MPYTTPAEVQSDFKSIDFSQAGANANTASVTQMIVEADSLINSYVGTVYTVPVTTGDGLNLLKLLSRSLVAGRIKKILAVKVDKNTSANQDASGVLLSAKDIMKILSDIQTKVIALAGAAPLVVGGGFFSKNADNSVCPVMEKGTKQW